MICAAALCEGRTINDVCTLHGPLCYECGSPCFRTGDRSLCFQCQAREDGLKCVSCGSPWVYIKAWDDRLLCRMCMINVIRENGWDSDTKEIVARLKADEEIRQAKQEKSEEANAQVTEMMRKLGSRAKPETEHLFEDEEPPL